MAMKPISLAGFEQAFIADADPWSTFSDHDEAVKRRAILAALGAGAIGRVLELGAGNGSNSIAIAPRARRLDAIEGTDSGCTLVAARLAAFPRARAIRLRLPARAPLGRYDAVVIAELLYYLSSRDMRRLGVDVAAALRPGGRLVLAHHRIDFHDFAQHAADIHARFLQATGRRWQACTGRRTGRWVVASYRGG